MKTSNLLLILAIALGSGAAYAAPAPGDETKHEANGPMKHEGFGVLKGVNTAEGKVRIAHEAIPALDWPGMTMWFALRAPLPPGIKVGDNIRFELQQDRDKAWVITRIELRK